MQFNKNNSVRVIMGFLLAAGAAMQVSAQETSQQDQIDALKKQLDQLEQNQSNNQQILDGMGSSKKSPVKFSGFLSIGLSQISEDDVEYGTGQGEDLSLLPTSYAGIQMNVDLYDSGEFVYQVVAKGNNGDDDSFELDTEWLYLKQDLGAGFNMQVGRIRFPAFMDSETYYIGTTYPWVAPPTEIYESLPLTNIDGVSVNHNALFGDWMLSTKVLLWGDASEGSSSYELALDDMYGVSLSLTHDIVSFRLAFMAAEEEIRIDSEPNSFLLEPMKETFGDDLTYLIQSVRFDNGYFYGSAEAVIIDADKGVLDENKNWNVTLGGYAGPVLIYIGMSETKVTNDDTIAEAVNEAFGFQMISTAYGAMPIGNVFAPFLNKQQKTTMVGIKYDFVPNATFKVQVQKVEDFDGTTGNFAGGTDMTFEDAYIYDIAVQASF